MTKHGIKEAVFVNSNHPLVTGIVTVAGEFPENSGNYKKRDDYKLHDEKNRYQQEFCFLRFMPEHPHSEICPEWAYQSP
jgi:hypothetical protein